MFTHWFGACFSSVSLHLECNLMQAACHKPFGDPAAPQHGGQSRSNMPFGHVTGDSPRYRGLRFCYIPYPAARRILHAAKVRLRSLLCSIAPLRMTHSDMRVKFSILRHFHIHTERAHIRGKATPFWRLMRGIRCRIRHILRFFSSLA